MAAVFFGIAYVYCFSFAVERSEQFRFSIRHLLVLTAAVAVLGAVGLAIDALILCWLLVYVVLSGRSWKRLSTRLIGEHRRAVACLTSGAIVSSFVGIVTAIALFLWIYAGHGGMHFPTTLWISLWPSAIFAWLFILGDNYRDDIQLVLYGLPIGLPVNLLLGFAMGSLLGLFALSSRFHQAN